ncbi:MAG TPA: NAD(P)H-binding protein, partial [Gordonia sp. (in: high G+C Gram-positive bacteria)]
MTTYAVTGATGGLGAAAVAALRTKGVPASDIVAVVRDAAKAESLAADGVVVRVAPYEDPDALAAALTGVDRLLLVSSPTIGQRTAQHTNVISAAAAAGVAVIAYTSLVNAPDSPLGLADEHRETEALLADFGGDHILLRNGWYWENFLANVEPASANGALLGAAGTGRVAGAARAELGEA